MTFAATIRSAARPIRYRLLRDMVLAIVLTAGILVAVNALLIGELRREFAWAQISEALSLVREDVRHLIDPVERQLLITRDLLRASNLNPDDHEALNAQLTPALTHLEQIAGLAFAGDSGEEYFLKREGSDWLTRKRNPDEPDVATWRRWGSNGKLLREWREPLEYDPRERPWFRAATANPASGKVTWTEPYMFQSAKVLGVSAATAWVEENAERVLALDVKLSRIVDAINALPLARDGKGFLFREDGSVYIPGGGDQRSAYGPGGSFFFSAAERLGGPLVFDAIASWMDRSETTGEPLLFSSDGLEWWGGFSRLSARTDSAWLGVAIPVSKTLGTMQSRWRSLALPAAAIVTLGIVLVVVLVRKYSRQLKDLPTLSISGDNPEKDLRRLISNGEDTHLEFKSTMRTNLRTGKAGKEIELAWLKGAAAFLNTEGGILLLGIADDGSVLGLDADEFDNNDKCRLHFKNLLNQHLGAENARHMRFNLHTLAGKRMAAVECERAARPVFLRQKNTESFLIRNGPANIELSISQAVRYIQEHF